MLIEPQGALPADQRGLYGISVTSELTGVPPQNLRAYEAKGLLEPARTEGGTRRYSDQDLARIERISTLLAAGLNTKGIGYVLDLEAESRRLREEIDRLRGVRRAGQEAGSRRAARTATSSSRDGSRITSTSRPNPSSVDSGSSER